MHASLSWYVHCHKQSNQRYFIGRSLTFTRYILERWADVNLDISLFPLQCPSLFDLLVAAVALHLHLDLYSNQLATSTLEILRGPLLAPQHRLQNPLLDQAASTWTPLRFVFIFQLAPNACMRARKNDALCCLAVTPVPRSLAREETSIAS